MGFTDFLTTSFVALLSFVVVMTILLIWAFKKESFAKRRDHFAKRREHMKNTGVGGKRAYGVYV